MKIKGRMNKILKKYSDIPAPIKASIWFAICSIMQKGVMLLTIPIFTRMLTTEQYGVYSVYQSWYNIISVVATLNLSGGVYNNGLTKYANDRKSFALSMQGLSSIATGIVFVIYLLNYRAWNDLLGLSSFFMLAMFVQMFFEPAYLFWCVDQRYDYKYKGILLTTVLLTLGSSIAGVIMVSLTDFKAEARILAVVLFQAGIGGIFYVYNLFKGKINLEYCKFALRFNLPLIPHYLSMNLLSHSDRIMISKLVGSSEAAIYSVAYSISMMMTIVMTAVNNSFIPYTYKAMEKKEYDKIKVNSTFLIILIGVLCIAAVAFGPEVIGIFAAREYYDAIWIMPPVAISVYFMFVYTLFGNIEFYYEKTKFIMGVTCIGAVINVGLNSIFIPIFGYYAAGYTTLVCYILFAFAHYIFYRKILKSQLPDVGDLYNIKFLSYFSIAILCIMLGMSFIYKYIILRYMIILVFILIGIWKRNLIISKMKELRTK